MSARPAWGQTANTGRPYGLKDFSWHFPSASPDGDPSPDDDDDKDCDGNDASGDDSDSGSLGDNPVDFTTGMKVETALTSPSSVRVVALN